MRVNEGKTLSISELHASKKPLTFGQWVCVNFSTADNLFGDFARDTCLEVTDKELDDIEDYMCHTASITYKRLKDLYWHYRWFHDMNALESHEQILQKNGKGQLSLHDL